MNTENKAKPFLRWAGGKQWLLPKLEELLPNNFKNYHEPFLGGGSVFIHLKSKGKINGQAYLSDLNSDLINSYKIVRDEVKGLEIKLQKYTNTEIEYYRVRDQKLRSPLSKAAQFIFLNRTSFNGIYRVNYQGKYNVPYGHKKYAKLFDFENFKNLNKLFQNTKFDSFDFYNTIDNIKCGDLVFLDPPYTVAHEHNGFIKYNQKIFQWKDQLRLKEYIDIVKAKGAYVILTNAAHKSIEDLHSTSGIKYNASRFSVVGGINAKRTKYNEFIFVV